MSIPLGELTRLSRFRDFEIKHMGQSYYVSSVILASISPIVAEMIQSGKPLTYELPPIPGQITKFFDLLNGNQIELNESNSLFLYSIAFSLRIKELLDVSIDTIFSNCNCDELVILASSLHEKNQDNEELVNLISLNFDKFIKLKVFKTVPISR